MGIFGGIFCEYCFGEKCFMWKCFGGNLLWGIFCANMFGDLLTDSSLSSQSMLPTYQGNADTDAILQEAHNVLEGRARSAMPEPPSTSLQHISHEKESMI